MAEQDPAGGGRFAAVVAKLSAVNVVAALAGVVTGPLQAQALGPAGRGALAAVLVPSALIPMVVSFGLPTYAGRAAARDDELRAQLGTVGALLLALGTLGGLAGIPLAIYLGDGRHVVETMLLISFCVMPIALLQRLAFTVTLGLSQYRAASVSRLIPPLTALTAIPVLFVLDALTVTSASIVALAGGLLAIVPLVPVVAGVGRPVFKRRIVRPALAFGARTWVGGVSGLANARLDQLVMITVVSERELGLYAIAVTFAGFSGIVTSALAGALLPRVARGDFGLAVRSLRVTLALVVVASAVGAVLAPVALPLLFGDGFAGAKTMVWVLLLAGVPMAGSVVLAAALAALGHPGVASTGQLLALGVTLAGLAVLLPPLGGEGAALVSLAAYSVNFAFIMAFVCTRMGGHVRELLVPTRDDARWLRGVLARRRA